jgi:hypothetical protein
MKTKKTKRKRTHSRDNDDGADDGAEGDDEDEDEDNERKDDDDDDDDDLHGMGSMGGISAMKPGDPMGLMKPGLGPQLGAPLKMVEDGWAQCEGCQKWRKLQPGITEW